MKGWGKFPHPTPADLVKAQQLVTESRADLQEQQMGADVLLVYGQQYEIVKNRFQIRKTVHTSDELFTNQELLEYLVKIGSSVIRKIK